MIRIGFGRFFNINMYNIPPNPILIIKALHWRSHLGGQKLELGALGAKARFCMHVRCINLAGIRCWTILLIRTVSAEVLSVLFHTMCSTFVLLGG